MFAEHGGTALETYLVYADGVCLSTLELIGRHAHIAKLSKFLE